jgi:hypothetical protein
VYDFPTLGFQLYVYDFQFVGGVLSQQMRIGNLNLVVVVFRQIKRRFEKTYEATSENSRYAVRRGFFSSD